MKFNIILIMLLSLLIIGCAYKNPFISEKRATSANLSEGYINKNAPIINTTREKPIFIPQKYPKNNITTQNDLQDQSTTIEMVGYILYRNIDKNTRLYYYTFTNAIKTQRLQFFSKEPIPYNPNRLVRIKVVDNFLVDYQPYRAITKKRKFNKHIKSAKEYFINLQ